MNLYRLFSWVLLLLQNLPHSNGVNYRFFAKSQNDQREIKSNRSAYFFLTYIDLIHIDYFLFDYSESWSVLSGAD